MSDIEPRVQCEMCDKTFKTRKILKVHSKQVHEKCEKIECSICKAILTNEWNLRDHIRRIHQPNNKKISVQCEKCDKTFYTKQTLRIHLKWIHEKREKVECHLCKAILTNEIGLKRHVRRNHKVTENKTLFPCDKCEKTFQEPRTLTAHLKWIHENHDQV